MTERAAVVLAGGYSTRFADGDKTLAELNGRPLIDHAVDSLDDVVDTVVVSCRDGQIPRFEAVLDDVVYRPDATDDQGPLAGLCDSLDAIESPVVALATADMPHVPASLYGDLFAELVGATAAVAVSDGEFVQPAPAVFERDALADAVASRRATGDGRLRSVLTDLTVETQRAARVRDRYGPATLADVNTVADMD